MITTSPSAFPLPSSSHIGHPYPYLDLPSLRPLPLHLLLFCPLYLPNLVWLHSLYRPLVSLLLSHISVLVSFYFSFYLFFSLAHFCCISISTCASNRLHRIIQKQKKVSVLSLLVLMVTTMKSRC